MGQRALITGIVGFAGSHLAEHLLDQGDTVVGIDLQAAWPTTMPERLRDTVPLIEWDLGNATVDLGAVTDQVATHEPTVIYHLAAVSTPAACGGDQPNALARAVNVDGTQRVLELAERLPTRPRVVFVSTSHVYDPAAYRSEAQYAALEDELERSGEPAVIHLAEDAPIRPGRGYGRTKLEAERVVQQAVAERGTDAVIVRAFQHAGPRQVQRLMLPEWIWQLLAPCTGALTIHTSDAWIDLTDVRDVVRAYRLVAEKASAGNVLNVGSGEPLRTGDLASLLLEAAEQDLPIQERHPGMKLDPIADITRLRELTGWTPEIEPRATIRDAWIDWRNRAGR